MHWYLHVTLKKLQRSLLSLRTGAGRYEQMLVFSSADDAALYTTGGDKINGVMIYNYNDPNLDTARWNEFRQAFRMTMTAWSPSHCHRTIMTLFT